MWISNKVTACNYRSAAQASHRNRTKDELDDCVGDSSLATELCGGLGEEVAGSAVEAAFTVGGGVSSGVRVGSGSRVGYKKA